MKVLFLDTVCPKPYSPDTLLHEAMGGTEATVVRIAERLSQESGYEVTVAQHNRGIKEVYGAKYIPLEESMLPTSVDICITLRSMAPLPEMTKRYYNAKHYLWLHDVTTIAFAQYWPVLIDLKCNVITVSNWHQTQTIDAFKAVGFTGGFKVGMIYNPIDDSLKPDTTPVNKNKLVFFSSPHKGLDYTLEVFRDLKKLRPDIQLHVANPGYFADKDLSDQGVIGLGALPHNEVIQHVREALCVFHLNTVFPETQGIVYQEANAVGTPFLAHDLGAIYESSEHPSQLINSRDKEKVIKTILRWYDSDRPRVIANSIFRMKKVIKRWIDLFDERS